ncbi:SDR family NAD(P)-dependent oxidoreductase [Rheinheimera texasensis]|uniref:SDR family NAD(P)-dependent oxidoreductase n=1 Tax=Rheinheimera texasensis TaxID=306205 RepID=UPI0032B11CC0
MKLAGIFSGMGSQWPQMAVSLQSHFPIFQQELKKLDQQVQQQFGWSVLQCLQEPDSNLLAQPEVANPCIFAVQLALFRQLQAQGLQFDMVLGHSTGEFAAACAAGALDVSQALALMHSHNQLIQRASAQTGYAMAQLSITLAEISDSRVVTPELWQGVVVSAENSPSIQIVSGPVAQLQALVAQQQTQQKFARLLTGAVPFHSPYLPEGDADTPQGLPKASSGDDAPTLYSSLRGGCISVDELTTDYWQQHIRQPVRFYPAVQAMLAAGADTLLEIAPHHILLFCLHEIAKTAGRPVQVLPTLKRGEDCRSSLQQTLAQLAAAQSPAQLTAQPEPHINTQTAAAAGMHARRTVAAVLAVIIEQLQPLLSLAPDQPVEPDRGFFQLGLTSVQVISFSQRLAAALQCEADLSWCFDYPTPLQLAAALADIAVTPQRRTELPMPTSTSGDIAIIGLGCRFPGGANDPDLFWQRLVQGHSAIREVPAERWQADAYYASDDQPGKSRSKWAGFLQDWDPQQFDAALFDISPAEAKALDPQQRLLLEVSLEAIAHAGLVPGRTLARDTGVFVGISTDDYKASQLYSSDLRRISTYTGSGCMYSAAAGRLSYWLGLQGPNKAVDTACSSSLVALHDACQAIRHGECSTALVGGVNLLLTPHLFVCFSALGALSPDGVCRAFADGANGYVRGEGCGVLVLKSRAQAEADGDQILALIAASAVNQDGMSSNLTAPNGAAQQQVIRTALQRAGISAADVSYVETHGTGTPLGDPVEAKALGTVYGQAPQRQEPLLIGSGKTQFGHLEAAAGILSVIKTTLMLNRQQLVATANADQPSALIDFAGLNLQVVRANEPRAVPYAAVSSFGFSGTNGHIILKAPEPPAAISAPVVPDAAPQLLTLSARDPQALTALARRWLTLLAAGPERSFADLCRASYLQRPHLRQRLAFVATDATDLQQQLKQYLAGAAEAQALALSQKIAAMSRQFAPLSTADADNYWSLLQPSDSLPADLLLPLSAELSARWQSYLQQAELSAVQPAAAELLRQQLAALLLTETGIDTSASESVAATTDLPLWPDRYWLLTQIASAYLQGADIHWPALQRWWGAATPGTAALLPHYPYQKKNFWLDPLPDQLRQPAQHAVQQTDTPALMNHVQQLAAMPQLRWYSLQFDRSQQFLAEHLIFQTPISPAAAHLAMLLTAVADVASAQPLSVRQLELHQPLVMSTVQRAVQLSLQGPLLDHSGVQAVAELRSSSEAGAVAADWLLHARADIIALPDSLYQQQQQRLQQLWPQQAKALANCSATAAAPWYQHLTGLGYQLGNGYQRIQQIWHSGPQQAWCRVDALANQDSAGAVVAPGLMDSLLQTLICTVPDLISQMQQGGWIYIPFSIGEVTQFAPLDQPYYWCLSESQVQGTLLSGRVLVFGADGQLKLLVDEFAVKQTNQQALLGKFRPAPATLCWRTRWQPVSHPADLAQPPATSTAINAMCYGVAPGASLPASWQQLLAVWPQDTAVTAEKQLLLLPALSLNDELADALQAQADWLRQQIPDVLATGRQLQLLVLEQASAAAAESVAANPHSAAIIALQQVLRLEYPGQIADLLLLPAEVPVAAQAALTQALTQAMTQMGTAPLGQVRRWVSTADAGQWLKPVLVAADTEFPAPATALTDSAQLDSTVQLNSTVQLDGTALLSGGQSALSAVVLPQLFAQGASAVVICSRRVKPADFTAWLASILPDPQLQQRVYWSHTDVCDAGALTQCLQWISAHLPPLQAIWHCAGQLADVSLARMSAAQLADVLAPKVRGSLNLHQLSLDLPLRQFVLFSSVAAVFGNFGQANYALANGFLNGLAQLRNTQGLPAVALCFGPWQSVSVNGAAVKGASGGMAQAQAASISAQGYQWLDADLLQSHWARLVAAQGQIVVAQADWPLLSTRLQSQPLLQTLAAASTESSVADRDLQSSQQNSSQQVDLSYWRQLPRPQAEQAMQLWLSQQVEAITGLTVDADQSLMAQGVDSLAAVTIRSTLSQQLGLRLPVSLLFNFPAITALASELCLQLFGAAPAPALSASATEATTNPFHYLEDLSEAELNALILQEFSAV